MKIQDQSEIELGVLKSRIRYSDNQIGCMKNKITQKISYEDMIELIKGFLQHVRKRD
jgi:hypothetical protein